MLQCFLSAIFCYTNYCNTVALLFHDDDDDFVAIISYKATFCNHNYCKQYSFSSNMTFGKNTRGFPAMLLFWVSKIQIEACWDKKTGYSLQMLIKGNKTAGFSISPLSANLMGVLQVSKNNFNFRISRQFLPLYLRLLSKLFLKSFLTQKVQQN